MRLCELVILFYLARFWFVVMVNVTPNYQHVAKKKCSTMVWDNVTLKLE